MLNRCARLARQHIIRYQQKINRRQMALHQQAQYFISPLQHCQYVSPYKKPPYNRARCKIPSSADDPAPHLTSMIEKRSAASLPSVEIGHPRFQEQYRHNWWKRGGVLLAGSLAGFIIYHYSQKKQINARGYEEGYASIDTFEYTIDHLANQQPCIQTDYDAEILYNSTTQLLFEVQEKIIQCKLISFAAGYPLYQNDWQRYKRLRDKAESLLRSLCRKNSNLTRLEDMQELEDAFFVPEGSEKYIIEGFLEGVGKAAVDIPKNVAKSVKFFVWDIPYWLVKETVDKMIDPLLGDYHLFRQRIDNYHRDIRGFRHKYEKSQFEGKEIVTRASELIIEAYDIEFDIDVFKGRCKHLRNDVKEARKTLLDEFCLEWTRKDMLTRFGDNIGRMSPAQRAEFFGYMMTSFVTDILLLDFLSDIAGLGELSNLGKNSRLGRWFSKTKGGRAFFKRIRKIHQRLRKIQLFNIRKGTTTARKARMLTYLEEQLKAHHVNGRAISTIILEDRTVLYSFTSKIHGSEKHYTLMREFAKEQIMSGKWTHVFGHRGLLKSLKTSCKNFEKVLKTTGRYMPDVLCLRVHKGKIVEAYVYEVLSATQKEKKLAEKLKEIVSELEEFIPKVNKYLDPSLKKSFNK
ncbi:MAG: hypothetical protein AAF900_01825 [Bacteroidota bacterium]